MSSSASAWIGRRCRGCVCAPAGRTPAVEYAGPVWPGRRGPTGKPSTGSGPVGAGSEYEMRALRFMPAQREPRRRVSSSLSFPSALPRLRRRSPSAQPAHPHRQQILMASLISAVAWIPRGAAAANPRKYVVDEAELERVGALARIRLEDAKMELELAQATATDNKDDEEQGAEQDEDWEDECVRAPAR